MPKKSLQQQNHKWIKIRFLLIVLVSCFVAILIAIYYCRVSEIFVQNKNAEEVTGIAGVYERVADRYRGKNLILLDENDVRSYIDSEIRVFKLVGIKKILPSKLDIILDPRDPKYVIQAPNGIFAVSDDYFIFSQADQITTSPNIVSDKELSIATYLNDEVTIVATKYSEFTDAHVSVVNSAISLMINDSTQVFLPEKPEKRIDEILSLLKKIVQKYSIENRAIESIDLRYDKPIVNFK